jgi:2-succinyl-6-hydroxy-2,4-cyclohexadiene-1-carboxylate synthase
MKFETIAVPGFLGLSSDYDCMKSEGVQTFDLNTFSWSHFYEFADQFNDYMKNRFLNPIVIGYSFGGRLAMHAVIQNPELWRACVFVSVHPGLQSENAKRLRTQSDHKWAERFLNESWKSLMEDWNHSDVFLSGKFFFDRKEEDYERKKLSDQLIYGSLGIQNDLRHAISQLNIPILWITGQNDEKFDSIAKSITLKHSLSKFVTIPNVGHRVIWENEEFFKEALEVFLYSLVQ